MAAINTKYVQNSGGCLISRQATKLSQHEDDTSIHRFWTTSPSNDFEDHLQLLEFDEKSLCTTAGKTWPLDKRITAIGDVSCFMKAGFALLAAAYKSFEASSGHKACLGLIEVSSVSGKPPGVMSSLPTSEVITSLCVSPYDSNDFSVLLVSRSGTRLVVSNEASILELGMVAHPGSQDVFCSTFDPHHPMLFSSGNSGSLCLWDRRQLKTPSVNLNLPCGARDVDFNPIVPHHLILGSTDGSISVWDTRQTSRPLRRLSSVHLHTVTATKFNPSHDQLFVTAGADGSAKLWRLDNHIKETTWNDKRSQQPLSASRVAGKLVDVLLRSVDEKSGGHEDGVVAVAWSSSDPWTFASLSVDGLLLFSSVPEEEKYRILLS